MPQVTLGRVGWDVEGLGMDACPSVRLKQADPAICIEIDLAHACSARAIFAL